MVPSSKIAPRSPKFLALVALCGLLSACAVGPNFHAPAPPQGAAGYAVPTPSPINANAPVAVMGEGPGAQWWRAFGSADLDALVARALVGNPGLAASNATLQRANQRIAAEDRAIVESSHPVKVPPPAEEQSVRTDAPTLLFRKRYFAELAGSRADANAAR